MMAHNLCISDGCNVKAGVQLRGLCMKCYSEAKKMVHSGHVSWEELERLGVCRANRVDTPFLKMFERKLVEDQNRGDDNAADDN